MGRVFGIDLGTTFSAIAIVNQHGRPEIVPNREGERITPSVVLFDGEMPIVGSLAKRSAVATPLNVVQFVKRQMGDPSWKFRTEAGDTFSPEEIAAMIVRRLKEDAEVALGESVESVVITVPAYFNDAQRKATQDAGRIAGVHVLRIINEPTAAALAYSLDKASHEQTVLVYDLGGGTFDVTIMRIGEGGIKVVATGGDKNLGGFNWDNEVMKFFNEEFQRQGGIDLLSDPVTEQDLRDKAEIAKKTLSSREKTNVFISAGGRNASVALTLAKFEEMTDGLLKRTSNIMGFVLEDSGLAWADIDKILLVGGSTRMKAVPRLVEAVTGRKPSMELHPDEAVAIGAAMQGALLQAAAGTLDLVERGSFPLVEIADVTSHSLGVIALDDEGREFNSIVLKKDTPVPSRASDVFRTVADRQREVKVRVTQGEDSDPAYVTPVGEGTMAIPPYPQGAPIEIFFEYDHDGIIHVTVVDKTTDKKLGEMQLARTANMSEEDVRLKANRLRTTTIG